MAYPKRLSFTFLVLSLSLVGAGQEITTNLPPEVAAAARSAFPEYDVGPTFDKILETGTTFPDPIIITRSYDASPNAGIVNPPLYPSQHIRNLVGRSDFVGIGTPVRRWTIPLEDKTFAVSVYLVHVSTVGIPGKDKIGEGQDIYIARAGGPVNYLGHNFRAIDPDFQLFHLDEPYCFFATEVIHGLYKVDAPRTLKIEGSTIVETSKQHKLGAFFSTRTPAAILNEAREANNLQTRETRD